jgi:hypothetical protein
MSDDHRIAYLSGEQVDALDVAERAELDAVRALLADESCWTEPPDGLEERVLASIAAELAGAAQMSEPRAGRRRRARLRLRLPRLTLPHVSGALAGAAAAAIVAFTIASGGASSGPAPLARFTMVVAGTPRAPGAHGSATLEKFASGWRIRLAATGLPHLAGASYYEAWLRNAAGVLVPVGTFNDARRVTLWSGVPVTQYRTLTVTRQLAGDLTSSHIQVLIGTIDRRH